MDLSLSGIATEKEEHLEQSFRNFTLEPMPPCTQVSYVDPAVESDGLTGLHCFGALPCLKRSCAIDFEEEAAMLQYRAAVVNERPVETEESFIPLVCLFDEHRMSGQRDNF